MPYTLNESGKTITLSATGRRMTNAFADAARGLFHCLSNTDVIRGDTRVEFALQAENMPALFQSWLEDLVARSRDSGMIFGEFSVLSIQKVSGKQYVLMGSAYGEEWKKESYGHPATVKAFSKPMCDDKKDAARCAICFEKAAL